MSSLGESLAALCLLYALSAVGGYSLYILKHGISVRKFTCKGLLKRLDIPPLVPFTSDWDDMDGVFRGKYSPKCPV